jgi:hypothetical protein
METLWEATWRGWPAATLAVLGIWWMAATVRREAPGLMLPVTTHASGVAMLRAGRAVLGGGALVAFAAGWAFHWPVVATLACVIGGEEMLEVGLVLAVLDAAEREGRWGPAAA